VLGLFVGKAEIYEWTEDGRKRKIKTAINKKSVKRCYFTKTGLETDVQVYGKMHGGEERAVLQVALENYDYLKTTLLPSLNNEDLAALRQDRFLAPGLGENISSVGMKEQDLCIGDTFQLGPKVILQISQPRQPCYKVNFRFNYTKMKEFIENEKKTGWFYRVLEEGLVKVGDKFILLERKCPTMNLTKVHLLLSSKNTLSRKELEEMKDCKFLAEAFRVMARKKLEKTPLKRKKLAELD